MFGLFRKNRKPEAPTQVIWHKPAGEYYAISGKVLDAEHSLIAGATGCGKSTFLHSVMHSALTRWSPAEAQFVLLDPKVVELNRYKDLPHTIRYECEDEGMLSALNEVISIMAARYQIMGSQGLTTWNGARLYVVIEELADLLCSPDKVKFKVAIQRIGQKGRAAGIHLILLTQAPSRKILSAEILLNITARFGLVCDSAIESKQVIGQSGCELLPAHGVCIYKYRRECRPYNLPFMTAEEVQPLINYWMSSESRTYA